MAVVAERDVKLDAKKRVTLSGAEYEHYRMIQYDDGRIVLEPRVLVHPEEISARTLDAMDIAMRNLERGLVSEPVQLTGGQVAFAEDEEA